MNNPSQPAAAFGMPAYKSHKTVWAVKIAEIRQHNGVTAFVGGSWLIVPTDPNCAPIEVPHAFIQKHTPLAGGYFVIYEDGYQSYSPDTAFETGYTLIDDTKAMSFGGAIQALEDGYRVARAGWNGKGMWLALSCNGTRAVAAEGFWSPHNAEHAVAQGGIAQVLPCITMKTATGEILMGWLASQTDMLAKDWHIVRYQSEEQASLL